jgi:predicted kinase
MKGLPGSGKSTFAKQMLTDNPGMYKRINRDELRMMFDHGHHSDSNEKFIRRVRDLLIIKSLDAGKSVIVDDTNLSEKTVEKIRNLVNDYNKSHPDEEEPVGIEIKEMETPLAECIVRDAQREKPVGAGVIKKMHRQFCISDPEYVVQDETLPKAIVCDMDGTLALLNGRNPYDSLACELDLPNPPVVNLVRIMQDAGYKLILVSGRKDDCMGQTQNWLARLGIQYELLLMRGHKDNRKDSIVKREIFDNFIKDKFYIEFVLDDRSQVVDMWRQEMKLPCFQVYYGDF